MRGEDKGSRFQGPAPSFEHFQSLASAPLPKLYESRFAVNPARRRARAARAARAARPVGWSVGCVVVGHAARRWARMIACMSEKIQTRAGHIYRVALILWLSWVARISRLARATELTGPACPPTRTGALAQDPEDPAGATDTKIAAEKLFSFFFGPRDFFFRSLHRKSYG